MTTTNGQGTAADAGGAPVQQQAGDFAAVLQSGDADLAIAAAVRIVQQLSRDGKIDPGAINAIGDPRSFAITTNRLSELRGPQAPDAARKAEILGELSSAAPTPEAAAQAAAEFSRAENPPAVRKAGALAYLKLAANLAGDVRNIEAEPLTAMLLAYTDDASMLKEVMTTIKRLGVSVRSSEAAEALLQIAVDAGNRWNEQPGMRELAQDLLCHHCSRSHWDVKHRLEDILSGPDAVRQRAFRLYQDIDARLSE